MATTSIRKRDMELISDDLTSLLKSISTPKRVEAKNFLFQEGDDAHELYVIQSGLFQISKLTSDGQELNMRICKTNDIIGELTIFSEGAKYMLSALALENSEILVINKELLEEELLKNANLTFEFMKWLSNHMRIIQSKIRDLVMNGKKGALYSTLIRLYNSYGIEVKDGTLINVHLTNQELAKFCAATRESVNRMLGDLKKKNIIRKDSGGKIIIQDVDYLREQNGCDYCPIEICSIE